MDGMVEELLRLESAKHRALIACDASSYEEQVQSQLRLLDGAPDLVAAAKESPAQVEILSRLIRLNAALLVNHVSASPVFVLCQGATEYTHAGSLQTPINSKFSLEA